MKFEKSLGLWALSWSLWGLRAVPCLRSTTSRAVWAVSPGWTRLTSQQVATNSPAGAASWCVAWLGSFFLMLLWLERFFDCLEDKQQSSTRNVTKYWFVQVSTTVAPFTLNPTKTWLINGERYALINVLGRMMVHCGWKLSLAGEGKFLHCSHCSSANGGQVQKSWAVKWRA